MCGIVGVINLRDVTSPDAQKYVKDGLLVGTIRGEDSTGILQLDKKFIPFVVKDAKHGAEFRHAKDVEKYITDVATSRVTVVHHRAATRGKVSAANAHPFTVLTPDSKRLVGVHNGTLYAWEGKKKKDKDVEVDSNWAFQHIAEEGADAFEDFSGAFAFIWWDEREPGKLKMSRNKERPMHFVFSEDKKQMFFGSEAGMVAWLTDRNNIKTEDEIYQLEPGKLYTFDLEGKEVSFTKTNLPSFRSTYVTPLYPRNSTYNNRGRRWDAATASYVDDGDWNYEDDYTWHGYSQSTGWRNQQPAVDYYDADGCTKSGTKTIEAIGSILSNARDRINRRSVDARKLKLNKTTGQVPSGKEKTVTHSQARMEEKLLDRVIGSALKAQVEQQLTSAGVDTGGTELIMPPTFYSDVSATGPEKQAAKSLGCLGELQWLSGVMYDDEAAAVIGEVEDYIVGQGKVKYDAELRHVTRAHADRMWINNKHKDGRNGDWVCIIGATVDQITKKRLFIVAPLTAEGKQKLHARAS